MQGLLLIRQTLGEEFPSVPLVPLVMIQVGAAHAASPKLHTYLNFPAPEQP